MERDEARRKVIDILLGDNRPKKEFFYNTFLTFPNYKEMTPISPKVFPNVNKEHKIVITENVYDELNRIRAITKSNNKEVAYLIYGEERENGIVYLDSIATSKNNSSITEASFDDISVSIKHYVEAKKRGDLGNKPLIICHGHTHGKTHVSDNFSFGDLISYVSFSKLYSEFQKGSIETIGMLMPPNGDYNFIMYEDNPRCEGFYTFPEVYLRKDNGDIEMLPSYQDGNYIKESNLSRAI